MSKRPLGSPMHGLMRAAALVALSLAILAVPGPTSAKASATAGACDQLLADWRRIVSQSKRPQSSKIANPALPTSAIPLRLAPARGSDSLEARFNYRSKGSRTETIAFNASGPIDIPVDQFRVRIESSLQRPDKETSFPDSQLGMAVEVEQDDGAVQVKVCIDPERPIKVAPGRYEGNIVVAARGIEQKTVPITLVVQDWRWPLALIVASLGVILGILVKALSDLQNINSTSSGTASPASPAVPATTGTSGKSILQQLRDYFKQPRALLLPILGLLWIVVAMVAGYMWNSTFGSSFMDWVKLLGFGFAAEVTGLTGIDAAYALRGGSP